MGTIFTTCPKTGREIATGIETDPLTLVRVPAFRSSIRCPHCNEEHEWTQDGAWIREHDGSRKPWPSQ